MKVQTGAMTEAEAIKLRKEINTIEFQSQFLFLKDHNGFRRGELHTLTSPKGSGKSSLIKGFLIEFAAQKKRVLVILSEEKVSMYRLNVFETILKICKGDNDLANSLLDNILFTSELDIDDKNKTHSNFFKSIKELVITQDIDILIYDNYTTGLLARGQLNEQEKGVDRFKQLTTRLNIATLLVYHTAKGVDVYKKILDGDDIRGSANSVNVGSYNYLLAFYHKTEPKRAFLIIDKSRYHTKANKKVYELKYDIEGGIYTDDIRSGFDIMQNLIDGRKKSGSIGGKANVNFN